ncbi:MAG: sulfite reductase subunit alpha, partial [Verrucomicrobia bacterium]|nr:sulfite reductase subunit alpha [Verrucomicrobiota bacterium]
MSATPTPTTAPAFSRNNPFRSHLQENRRLNQQGSSKDTRHIVIQLGSSGPTYQCGDSLGVVPRNPESLIREFTEKLGLHDDAVLHETLATSAVLNRVGKKFVKAVAEKATGSAKDNLQA